MAFYSLGFKPGDRILTARAEYASNVIAYLQVARRTGAVVEVVEDDEHGQFSVAELKERLGRGPGTVKLIAMTHVPTHGGLVNPAEEVGAVAREAGVPFLLDACQSAGQLGIDVQRIGCDMLSGTGRKFLRGPAGHRIPVRAARDAGQARAAVPRPARRDLDRPWQLRDPRRRAAIRELGDQLRGQGRPRHGGRVRAVLGPRRHRGPGDRAGGRAALAACRRSTGCGCTTRACDAARSSPSAWRACLPRRFSVVSRRTVSTPACHSPRTHSSTCRTAACPILSAPPCTTTTPTPNWTGSSPRSPPPGLSGSRGSTPSFPGGLDSHPRTWSND